MINFTFYFSLWSEIAERLAQAEFILNLSEICLVPAFGNLKHCSWHQSVLKHLFWWLACGLQITKKTGYLGSSWVLFSTKFLVLISYPTTDSYSPCSLCHLSIIRVEIDCVGAKLRYSKWKCFRSLIASILENIFYFIFIFSYKRKYKENNFYIYNIYFIFFASF